MTKDEFNAVSETLKKWNPRTLEAMEMLLVRGMAPVDVSKALNMPTGQLITSRTRFMAKVPEVRRELFISNNPPAGKPDMNYLLRDHLDELNDLSKRGYTPAQLIEYLKSHGIKVTAKQVSEALKP